MCAQCPTRARVGRTQLSDHKLAPVARISKRQRQQFLQTLAQTGTVAESARQAGIGRRTAYDWHDRAPAFRQAWDNALDQAANNLAENLWLRGGGPHPEQANREQTLQQLRHLQRLRARLSRH